MKKNGRSPAQGGNLENGAKAKNKTQNQFSRAADQRQASLNRLASYHLTTIYARDVMGIMHPGGRVAELRRQGFRIVTHWTWEPGASGKMHRVAKYMLESKKPGSKNGAQ